VPDNLTLDAADMVEIDHDPLADETPDRRYEGYAPGGHVHGLAGEFLAARQHVAAEERHRHALVPATVGRP
jgi:hypothetical protein